MWKQVATAGAVGAAVIGVCTAAIAASGSAPITTGAPTASATDQPGSHGGRRPAGEFAPLGRLGRNVVHGSFVTRNPQTKQLVTHQVIHGAVTSVSASSITVKASDNTSETFTVTSDTKVRERKNANGHGRGAASTIGAVKSGDQVLVAGTGTGPVTATVILRLPG